MYQVNLSSNVKQSQCEKIACTKSSRTSLGKSMQNVSTVTATMTASCAYTWSECCIPGGCTLRALV